jgi:hypothetical protein
MDQDPVGVDDIALAIGRDLFDATLVDIARPESYPSVGLAGQTLNAA